MSQDTNVENLIINKLTKAQYENIANPDSTQLYFVTDEVISSSDVISALGYTPYNATNPNGYITASALTPYALSADLASVATSGDYDDLINKPTIPTVNNGTLTIQKNGTTIGTFTANQSGNSTVNIEADTVLTDDITVSKNSDEELQAIGVIDNNSGNAIKTWTGTKAQYEAIVTKDSTTLYFLTDVGKIYFGDTLISNVGNNTLLDFKWADHKLNDIQWLRADTFSWQSGDVYVTAYNHLVQDIQGITAETETIGSYTVTFYRATDGHKVALADQEQTVLNIYNTYGIAWYYILDTTNTQFKLPRTKYGFEGLRTNVGDKIDESLPNVKDTWNTVSGYEGYFADSTGAIRRTASYSSISSAGNTNYTRGTIELNLSNGSSTYQNNAPVQERATQMYLYFYVGDYSQTAIEQTAGLNSELFNGKVDLNASNLNAQGMSYIAGLGMPSDTYVDLTLGASGSTYTAPANGYYFIDKIGNSGQYLDLGVYDANTENLLYEVSLNSSASATNLRTTIPILKNNVLKIWYNASGNTVRFRFIYAQGSESEAS